jgi:hypothetical protein
LLTWSFRMTGIGRMAKRRSVMMLMIELNSPMKLYVRLGKHRVFGIMRTRILQLAAIGVHWNKRVPEHANAKHVRKTAVVSLLLYEGIGRTYRQSSTRRRSNAFVT